MAIRECTIKNDIREQLLFWDSNLTCDIDIEQEVRSLKERQEKLRKGLFQRYSDLCKEVQELRNELMVMKINERK